MLGIPRVRQRSSVHLLQVISASSVELDDLVRSFPYGSQLPLGRVFCCEGHFSQHQVLNFEFPVLHSSVVVMSHSLLVDPSLCFGLVANLVQEI